MCPQAGLHGGSHHGECPAVPPPVPRALPSPSHLRAHRPTGDRRPVAARPGTRGAWRKHTIRSASQKRDPEQTANQPAVVRGWATREPAPWLQAGSPESRPVAQAGQPEGEASTARSGDRTGRRQSGPCPAVCPAVLLNEAEPPPSLAEERPLTTPKPTEPGGGQGGRGQEGEEKAPTPAHTESSTSARDARPRAARVGLADVRPREPGRRLLQARPAPERRPPAGARGELTPSSCLPPHMWACRQALQP